VGYNGVGAGGLTPSPSSIPYFPSDLRIFHLKTT
jgi:hypothetical protein